MYQTQSCNNCGLTLQAFTQLKFLMASNKIVCYIGFCSIIKNSSILPNHRNSPIKCVCAYSHFVQMARRTGILLLSRLHCHLLDPRSPQVMVKLQYIVILVGVDGSCLFRFPSEEQQNSAVALLMLYLPWMWYIYKDKECTKPQIYALIFDLHCSLEVIIARVLYHCTRSLQCCVPSSKKLRR